MKSFLIALQFLTRIHLAKQTVWTNEDFGRSVIFFPLVGTIIGAFLWLLYTVISWVFPPPYGAVLIVAAWLYITGGLHADGLMDTADGVLSGRSRERMLDILKDSRVGASGVMVFVFVMLLKITFVATIPSSFMGLALLSIPTAARVGTLVSIFAFPYAREQGLGRAFQQYQPSYVLAKGLALSCVPFVYGGPLYACYLGLALLVSLGANRYLTSLLGGVTGDTYGAVLEGTEMVLLAVTAIVLSPTIQAFINTV